MPSLGSPGKVKRESLGYQMTFVIDQSVSFETYSLER